VAQKSGFFKSISDDRVYYADDFANRFRQFMTTGVLVDDSTALTTELQVTANDTDLNVSINLGGANVEGYFFEVYTAAETLTLDAGDVTYDRIDRIIVRRNVADSTRSAILAVLKGTPAASPAAPALTQSGDIYEISLAQILVPQSASLILNSNVTDERDMVEIKVRPVGLSEEDLRKSFLL